jgi:prepilin-type N-terminal cleavage/methylation domain-containing protein
MNLQPGCRGPCRSRKAGREWSPGFSLLELLAVVTLIGIIAAVIVPRISVQALQGKTKVCYQYKADLNSALERFYFNTGSFATNLTQIENNDDYYPDVVPVCPVDGSAYTLDPTTHWIQGHAH